MKFFTTQFRGNNLRGRLLRGGAWLGSGSFLEQASRFGRNMLLARLLLPEVFGTMAIVLSAGAAIDSFTEIGVREAIIQNPRGREPEFMNGAWWVAFTRALALYALLFTAAPFLAGFYGNPQLKPLLRLALVSLLFTGATSPGAYSAMKDLRFKRWAAINHGGAIAGVLLTVGLALLWRNVWALAIGFAAENLSRFVLSYAICPFVPRLPVARACVREVLNFSRRAVGLPFLNFVFIRADIFVIGKLFPPALLGLYSMAINVAQVPAAFAMNLLGQLLMPTFAQLQDDHRKLNKGLLRVTSLVACLGAPVLVFAAFSGGQILRLVYGQRYAAMAAPFVMGIFLVLINLLNGQITTVFYAKGRPNLHRRSVGIMAAMMVVLIYPLVHWFGIVGAPAAALLAALVGYGFQIARIHQLTGLRLGEYARALAPAGVLGVCVVVVRFGLEPFVPQQTFLMPVLPTVIGCLLAYAMLLTKPLQRMMVLTGME
jgi:O-antigen/teichoic acid export membrane protein